MAAGRSRKACLCCSVRRATSGISPAASTAALWNGQPRTAAGERSASSRVSKIASRRWAGGRSSRLSCRSDSRAPLASNWRRYSSTSALFDSNEDVPAFVELESGGPLPRACQVVGVGQLPSHPTREGDRREQHLPEEPPPWPQ